jgi:hypothetical protein
LRRSKTGRILAGQQPQDRRFPGAVDADQPDPRPRPDVQVQAIQHPSAEGLDDAAEAERAGGGGGHGHGEDPP